MLSRSRLTPSKASSVVAASTRSTTSRRGLSTSLRLNARRARPLATSLRTKSRQFLQYSTERALKLRNPARASEISNKLLYTPENETENCGVGLIASLKSEPTRDIVNKADEMLVRMAHRGGCGSDPASGDGSGE